MRFAIINNKKIKNIIEADAMFAIELRKTNTHVIDVTAKTVAIGDRYDGVKFTAQKQSAHVIPFPDAKIAAYAAIDTAAGNARLRYVTQGALQQQVYDIKAAEAAAYIAAGYPTATTLYPLITAQATGTSTTVKIVADTIIATKTTWLALAGKIEALRISGKSAVKSAKTLIALQKAEADAVAALEVV